MREVAPHRRLGGVAVARGERLPLAQVLQPAIQLADQGFAATPRFVASPVCSGTNLTSRAKNSPLSAEYFCPGGQQIPEGALVTNKPLADLLNDFLQLRKLDEALESGGLKALAVSASRLTSWDKTPVDRKSVV